MKTKRLLACFCAFLLTVTLVPAAAFARGEGADSGREPIEELLVAGDYVEGEAIAVVRAGADVAAADQVEDLADASADSVELATAGALNSQGIADDQVAQRVQSVKADSYTIKHVVDHGRTTEQILRDLYSDQDVVSAEPNYLIQNPAALNGRDALTQGAATALGAGGSEALPMGAEANTQDLTNTQWPLDSSLTAYGTTPRSPTNTYSMNVPGWVDGRTNAAAPANATTGTVCIMDTGVDITHPDLQGVLFDFSDPNSFPADRYAQLKAEYGMGQYGLNASGGGKTDDVTGYDSHGTHVAGIVAAQWNDFGVSGIANGTKIFSLRIFGDDGGTQNEAALLGGFKFLVDVAKDANLKAVNCSWGSGIAQFSYEVMVNELGKKGVNVVYASGNRSTDLDETLDNGGMSSSPYSITVNAAQPDGKMTEFSCYGQASTDVFAPGAQIPSTISQEIVFKTKVGSLDGRKVFKRLFPQATDSSNLLAYEQFSSDTPGVRLFKNNPAINTTDPQEITGFVDTSNGYGDKRAAAVNVSSLNKGDKEAVIFTGMSGYVYAAIPVDTGAANPSAALANVKHVSLDLAMSDSFKPSGGIASITCAVEGQATPGEVDTSPVKCFYYDGATWLDGVNSGLVASAMYTVYQCQWSPVSMDVDEFIAYSNHAHQWLQDNPGKPLPGEEAEGGGYEHYKDPGKVTGVYGWQDGGKTYVIVKVGLATPLAEPSSTTKLLLDNVAIGTSSAYVASYENMPGTSMAAPAVTGCLAVIAKGEKNNADMTDAELEQAALERASKLLASVDYDDELSKLCRTGGRVDLNHQSTFTKKAPIITRVVADGDALSVSGYFFSASGTLAVDDVEVPATSLTTWSDTSIAASLAGLGLANGSHVLKVTNEDGAIMRMVFSYSSEQAKGRPLYERTHGVPVNDTQFIADKSDRLYGDMVYCDGSLYALTAEGKNCTAQALWRFDTGSSTWSRCADLPEAIEAFTVKSTSLFSYKGAAYVKAIAKGYKDGQTTLWKYDAAGNSWTEVTLANDKKWPSGEFCARGDDLIMVGVSGEDLKTVSGTGGGSSKSGGLYAVEEADQDAGDDGLDTGSDYKNYCGLVDLDAGTITKIEGSFESAISDISIDRPKIVASAEKIYLFAPKDKNSKKTPDEADYFVRLTYDKANNTMSYEDLRPAIKEAVGFGLVPEFDRSSGEQDNGAYIALAGLPDGVAIVGSASAGEDTHVVKDDSAEVMTYDRTSSYHHAFEPLAAWGDDGFLYVTGTNATEPDVMYFRSTYYGKADSKSSDDSGASTNSDTLPKTGDVLRWLGVVLALAAAMVAAVSYLRRRSTTESSEAR